MCFLPNHRRSHRTHLDRQMRPRKYETPRGHHERLRSPTQYLYNLDGLRPFLKGFVANVFFVPPTRQWAEAGGKGSTVVDPGGPLLP